MEKKKVLHFLWVFSPVNGIGVLLKNYAGEFGAENMPIVSIQSKNFGLREDAEKAAAEMFSLISIRDRLMERSESLPEKDSPEIKRMYAEELRRIILEEQPDCLHVHYSGLLEYVKRIRTELTGIRIFFTCHGEMENIFFGPDSPQSENARTLIRENGLQIIALHEEMREKLQERFGAQNVVVVNNGIPLRQFCSPRCSAETVRLHLKIPQDAFVIGHVGMFVPLKNHNFLIRIFLEMFSRSDKVFLLMTGRGGIEEVIQYKLDTLGLSGHYLRIPSSTNISEVLAAMDVFVFPSRSEGFPMALLEAQAAGLPCVKSDHVPDSVIVTDHIVSKSLEDPISEWCDLLLHPERIKNDGPIGDINDYDAHAVTLKLDQLYSGGEI